MIKFIQCRV